MKTLILFLLLAFSVIGYSQDASTMLLLMGDGYKNPETTLYLAGQTVSVEQATRIDNFITMLKDSLSITSLSSKFDVMYLLANETAALGLRNLVKRSHDATAVNSPTFTAFEGFTGNGSSNYINTNYDVSVNKVNVSSNSVAMGCYLRTNSLGLMADMGGTRIARLWLLPRWVDLKNYSEPFSGNTFNLVSPTITTSTGLQSVVRVASDTARIYRNGNLIAESNVPSGGVTEYNIFILARHSGTLNVAEFYSTRQNSFAYISSGLTPTEIRKLYNCIQWYMTQLGKQV